MPGTTQILQFPVPRGVLQDQMTGDVLNQWVGFAMIVQYYKNALTIVTDHVQASKK